MTPNQSAAATAAPLCSWTVRIIWQRWLQPTGRFRRWSLSLVVGESSGDTIPNSKQKQSADKPQMLALAVVKEVRRMLKDILNNIKILSKLKINVLCILIGAIVLVIDYITGRHIQFPITYIIPVGLAAWQTQKTTAYAIAIILPLMRVVFHFPWHETQSLYVAVLNALIDMVSLIFYAYLIDRSAWQTRALEKKVRTLEGILPICASCKRIRTETGDYEQIEKYITNNSEASFSHGICPECAKKLYPELFKDTQK